MSIRVFCPECKGGDNWIWKGSLFEWGLELAKHKPPAWFLYAQNHARHHKHKIMVEYPSGQIVPLKLKEKREQQK